MKSQESDTTATKPPPPNFKFPTQCSDCGEIFYMIFINSKLNQSIVVTKEQVVFCEHFCLAICPFSSSPNLEQVDCRGHFIFLKLHYSWRVRINVLP